MTAPTRRAAPAPPGPSPALVAALADLDDAAYDAWVDSQAAPDLTPDHLIAE